MQARRFLRYLDYWRRHGYSAKLLDLEQVYEPFSPDTDLLQTRTFSAEERHAMQQAAGGAHGRAAGAGQLHARRSRRLPHHPDQGLPLRPRPAGRHRRLRGAPDLLSRRHHHHRAAPRHQEGLHGLEGGEGAGVPAPLHPLQAQAVRCARARGDARRRRWTRRRPRACVRRQRKMLPDTVTSDYVYIKLFKNMPRSDVEMAFPNTKVRFRLFDKIKFGVTAGSGFGVGVVGTAGKLALCEQSLHAGDDAGGPRRRRRAPGHRTSSTSATATWWCWRATSTSTPWPTTAA